MLIILLRHPDEHEFSYARLRGNATSGVWQRGNWGEVSRLAQRDNVVLLIPGRDVLLIRTTLVTSNARQLKQALPYALEENLIGDPADQHFVWQTDPDQPDTLDVAVIERETLKSWMALLKKHRIRVRTILPDIFALPIVDDAHAMPVIMQHGNQVRVRTGALSGFVASGGAAPMLVNNLFSEDDEERAVWLYADQPADWHNSLQILREPQPEQISLQGIQQGAALNLLNGYQDVSMSSFTRHWKRWRTAAVFGVLTLGILGGIEGAETWQLKQRLEVEEKQNLTLFKEVFPDIKNIDVRSLRSRVKSEIRLLEQQAGGGEEGKPSPLPYMATVAKTFRKQRQFKITEIRARKGDLVIRFDSPSVEMLEKLGQDLGKDLGFEPRIKSTLSGGGVRAELTLEAQS